MQRAEVLVVGAGPAGLATAIALARRGLAVRVVDRRSGPLDKACGEGIMPPGVRALEGLGVSLAGLRAAPFRGVRFVDGDLRLEGCFATGPGLGVRRTELSRALLHAARRAGVEVELGCGFRRYERAGDHVLVRTTRGLVRTRLLVGADGLGSGVRKLAALDAPARSRRFGLRRHFRVAPWSPFVEVHWGAGIEAYVTPVAPDEVGVAILGRGEGRDYTCELSAFPELLRRLEGAEPASEVRGAGPFWQRARALTAPGVALVGDAAGYTDAVTGEGITLALRAGALLAGTFAEHGSTQGYERAWQRLTRTHRSLAALLGLGIDHPRARRTLFRLLARWPAAFGSLLRLAAAEHGGGAPVRGAAQENGVPFGAFRGAPPARSRLP